MAALVLITAPAVEPVTVTEAKDQARVCHDGDDGIITSMIVAARKYLEDILHRSFVETTWELFLDHFPGEIDDHGSTINRFNRSGIDRGLPPFVSRFNDRSIRPTRSPLLSVTTLKYIDGDGVTQTLVEGTDYDVDTATQPGRVFETFNTSWPTTQDVPNSVILRFKAGYGTTADDVPEDIKMMIKSLVAYYYENREPYLAGATFQHLPAYLDALIQSNRIWDFA